MESRFSNTKFSQPLNKYMKSQVLHFTYALESSRQELSTVKGKWVNRRNR